MIRNFAFLILTIISISLNGYGQVFDQFSASINSEAIGLPFTNYDPLHPGFELNGTIKRIEKPKSIRYLNTKIGFFYHRRLETAIYIGGEYQHSLKLFRQKISLDLPIGLGYLHSFYPGEVYEQNDNGDFEKINQTGRAHFYTNLGIGFTYLSDSKVQPYIRQELLLETPFANGIPIITHSLVKVGVQIKL